MKNQINPSDYHSLLTLDRGDIFSKDSWLSKSAVWELFQSSLYRWRYHPKKYSTGAMRWGSLVDCLVTSPEDFDSQFTMSEFDSYRTKEAREWKAQEEERGVSIIKTEDLANARKAAEILTSKFQPSAEIIERSASQVVMLNRVMTPHSDKPVGLKALADFVPEGTDYLADLKTTADFTATGFAKTIGKFGYHAQAAHYLQMHNLQNPDDQRDRFLIIWQQSSAPYEVAVTEIPKVDIMDGQMIFDHLLGRIIKAAESDYWAPLFPKPALLGRASFSVYDEEAEMEGHTGSPDV